MKSNLKIFILSEVSFNDLAVYNLLTNTMLSSYLHF